MESTTCFPVILDCPPVNFISLTVNLKTKYSVENVESYFLNIPMQIFEVEFLISAAQESECLIFDGKLLLTTVTVCET